MERLPAGSFGGVGADVGGPVVVRDKVPRRRAKACLLLRVGLESWVECRAKADRTDLPMREAAGSES